MEMVNKNNKRLILISWCLEFYALEVCTLFGLFNYFDPGATDKPFVDEQ